MNARSAWRQDRTLNVLLVEHDPALMSRTCELLVADGLDVTTARSAMGLYDRVTRVQPDIVLMDLLIPDLDARELAHLAERCRAGNRPALVIHTKMLKPMLRRVLDVRAVFGFISKTGDGSSFMHQFHEVTDRLVSEMPTDVFVPRSLGGASSGTYAVKPSVQAPICRAASSESCRDN